MYFSFVIYFIYKPIKYQILHDLYLNKQWKDSLTNFTNRKEHNKALFMGK